jgi:hypothetical protein
MVAVRILKELEIQVQLEHGAYGEYRVILDGRVIIDGGARVIIGVHPSTSRIVEAVRSRLSG